MPTVDTTDAEPASWELGKRTPSSPDRTTQFGHRVPGHNNFTPANFDRTFTLKQRVNITRKLRVKQFPMTLGPIDSNRQSPQNRIDALRDLPLEPLEYCQKWVELSQEERGYRKACVEALAEATDLSPRTIENWGKSFEKRKVSNLSLVPVPAEGRELSYRFWVVQQ